MFRNPTFDRHPIGSVSRAFFLAVVSVVCPFTLEVGGKKGWAKNIGGKFFGGAGGSRKKEFGQAFWAFLKAGGMTIPHDIEALCVGVFLLSGMEFGVLRVFLLL